MATATKTRKIQACCPECLDDSNELVLVLSDLPTCRCECGAEFTPAEAAAKMARLAARWERISAWVADAPVGD